MTAGFSIREAARMLKLPERRVRAYIRAGLVSAEPGGDRAGVRLEFRDLIVLKLARTLVAEGVSIRRVQRLLAAVKKKLGDDRPLSAITVRKASGRVVVDDGTHAWEPETGQQHLRLTLPTAAPAAANPPPESLPGKASDELPLTPAPDDAEQWFQVGLHLEDTDPEGAYHAYLRALAANPEHTEATINIGRMCATAGQMGRAAAYFRQAVRLAPDNAIALFNLAVTLHDAGQLTDARNAYQSALRVDPHFADAHFNLAALLDQIGESAAALEHLQAYQAATDETEI